MKHSLVALAIAGLTITACNNKPEYIPELTNNFNYSMVKEVIIAETRSSAGNVDVLSSDGSIIAQNIPLGKSIVMAKNETYTTRSATVGTPSTVYFPNKGEYASMWIEDEFPYSGDYDMNDAIFEFQFKYDVDPETGTTNAITIRIKPIAAGTSKSDLGLALVINGPLLVNQIGAVTGTKEETFTNGLFKNRVNGIEDGADIGGANGAVVIPLTGDLRSYFEDNPRTGFINTVNKLATHKGEEFEVTVNLTKEIGDKDLTLFMANPSKLYNISILVLFDNRGKEIQMRGCIPSVWYNKNYSKTLNKDATFSDKDNKVWMIMVPKSIEYAIEHTSITKAFPDFENWFTSGGSSNENWYKSPNSELTFSGKK